MREAREVGKREAALGLVFVKMQKRKLVGGFLRERVNHVVCEVEAVEVFKVNIEKSAFGVLYRVDKGVGNEGRFRFLFCAYKRFSKTF